MEVIRELERKYLKEEITTFNVGDIVRIHIKIIEGKRKRVQTFEGIVLAIKNSGTGRSFKVRRVSYGVGVERTFLLNSPRIEKIEVIRKGKVRKAKLYYLRGRVGKAAQVKESIRKSSK